MHHKRVTEISSLAASSPPQPVEAKWMTVLKYEEESVTLSRVQDGGLNKSS